jgi:hypothetical protein
LSVVNNADALNSLAKQCDEVIVEIDDKNKHALDSLPPSSCGAHWPTLAAIVAGNKGTQLLLHCRAEEYRERISVAEGREERQALEEERVQRLAAELVEKARVAAERMKKDAGSISVFGLKVPTVGLWALAVIVAALAGAGVLGEVIHALLGK